MKLIDLQETNHIEPLNEIFKYTRNGGVGEFNYGPNNGRTMVIEITKGGVNKGDGEDEEDVVDLSWWTIVFYPKVVRNPDGDQFAMDDSDGDAHEIFTTIFSFVDSWYKENHKDVTRLTAETQGDKVSRRNSLYALLANRLAKKHGGEVHKDSQSVRWYPPKPEQPQAT